MHIKLNIIYSCRFSAHSFTPVSTSDSKKNKFFFNSEGLYLLLYILGAIMLMCYHTNPLFLPVDMEQFVKLSQIYFIGFGHDSCAMLTHHVHNPILSS